MKKLILASALLLTAAGCSSPDPAPSQAASSAAPAATAQPANTVKESANQMLETSKSLTELLKTHKDDAIHDQIEKLESIWEGFEDNIKPSYPELYAKVEKYLSPLNAGAGQKPLDYDALDRFNAGLIDALTELQTTVQK